MASNNTIVSTEAPEATSNMWIWMVFIGQGTAIVSLNVPIWASIVRHVALRCEKQYVIIAGLALADSCNGLAYIVCGIYRSVVTLLGTHTKLVSPFECVLVPHNLLWCWTETVATLTLAVVSVDRLLSVVMPLEYLRLPASYAWKLLAASFGYSLASGVTGYAAAWFRDSEVMIPNVCYQSMTTGPAWFGYFGTINTTSGFSSIVIYMVIGILMTTSYKRQMRKIMASNERGTNATKKQAQRQKKMTESLAICCFFTLIFYCIPYITVTRLEVYYPEQRTLAMVMWMITPVNPMLNSVIYLTKHREMRMGVIGLFTGKKMPPALNTWLQIAAHSNA